MYLGVGGAGLAVPPFADDRAILDNDAAYRWIGRCPADTLAGQRQGALHENVVSGIIHQIFTV
jgi:hypothetical protein